MAKHVLLLGATGSTGSALLKLLLDLDPSPFERLCVLTRRPIPKEPLQGSPGFSKLQEVLVPDLAAFNANEEAKAALQGLDVCFCCLGTTSKQAGSAEKFVQIDRDIPLSLARAFRAGRHADAAQHFLLVSSSGSNASSFLLYPRTKGQLENSVAAIGFEACSILRPRLLLTPPREHPRVFEEVAQRVLPLFGNSLSIDVHTLAKSLIHLAFPAQAAVAQAAQLGQPLKGAVGSALVYEHSSVHALAQ